MTHRVAKDSRTDSRAHRHRHCPLAGKIRAVRGALLLAVSTAAGSGAHAQSSVTLYGVIDTNIEYVNNLSATRPTQPGFPGPGHSRLALSSGGLSGSRWGLRGREQLDGELAAVFDLQSGFTSDDGRSGQSGRLFGRQAYVGLDHRTYGRITFGRQYTPIFDAFSDFSPSKYGTQYEPIVVQLGLDLRSDNVAKYTGRFGPLTAIAGWSFGNGVLGNGEVPGQIRRDAGYGGALTYFQGAFGAALAFNRFYPSLAAGVGTFTKAGAALSYSNANVKLMGGYRWGMDKAADGRVIVHDGYYWAGINYQATRALELTLAYYYEDLRSLNGTRPAKPWQLSLIADYSFSRRTDLYLSAAYAKNAGLNLDTSAVSYSSGYFPGAGKSGMLGVALGVRHKF